jgi:hypothetical protein
LFFIPITTSIEHNDGGANCFIINNKRHFVNLISRPLQVQQLDGSIAVAEGYGLKLIQHLPSKYVIPLWPTYFMPNNTQCTFSPTALKHYLKYPSITTYHLQSLHITTPCNQLLEFPSLAAHTSSKALDFHQFHIVQPAH